MTNEVEIIVRSQDKSAAGLDSAKKRVRETSAEIEGMADGAGRSATETEGHFKRMSGAIGTAMTGVGVAIAAGAGVALANFTKDSIRAASDLEESINAVNVTFGKSAVVVQDWGENNAAQFGLSRRAFNELAAPLGAMLRNAGLSMQDTTKWTIELTKRAADMASVFGGTVPEALEAIQAGLRGESDPLEKFGVGLSAAKVEAEALAETGKKSASTLTEQEKATARLNVIMKQTEQTAGDFKNTSDGLANAQRQLASDVENAKARIGEDLTPIMAKATIAASDLLHAVTNLGEYVSAPGLKAPMFRDLKGNADDIKALDERLSALVHAGAAREAATQMLEASEAAKKYGIDAVELGQLFPKYGQALSDTARQTAKTSGATQDLTKSLNDEREALNKAETALLGQREAARNLEASYDDAAESIKKNGKNLDIGTEKGRANQAALDGIATAAYGARDAIIEQGGSQADANKVMETAKAKFIATATSMGMAKTKAQELATQLFAIPQNVSTNYSLNLGPTVSRLAWVRGQLREIQALASSANVREDRTASRATGGVVGQAATGGVRSNRVMVGEHGPEVVDLAPGSYVHSNPDTERLLSAGGKGTANVVLEINSSGSRIDDFLLDLLRQAIRVRGGNVQAVIGRN